MRPKTHVGGAGGAWVELGLHMLSRRWAVERTCAWLLFNRRLIREYERLCATTETWIYQAMIRLMVRRLVRTR